MSVQFETPPIEVEVGGRPTASIIWLHGLGADGHDFEPIVPELDLPGLALRFIFPHAPYRAVTLNQGYRMRAWYDLTISTRSIWQNEDHMREARSLVEGLIARERRRGIDAQRIVLAGFSQGGAVVLYTAVRHAERLAGVMALSTYLPFPERLETEATGINRDLPVLMAHGREDGVIPMQRAQTSREQLVAHGADVEWHDYAMGHGVCPQEIADIGAWLRRRLV